MLFLLSLLRPSGESEFLRKQARKLEVAPLGGLSSSTPLFNRIFTIPQKAFLVKKRTLVNRIFCQFCQLVFLNMNSSPGRWISLAPRKFFSYF